MKYHHPDTGRFITHEQWLALQIDERADFDDWDDFEDFEQFEEQEFISGGE